MTTGATRTEIVRAFIPSSPLPAALGITLESIEPDRARLAMRYADALATMGDVIHGGAIAALADTAAMAAAWATDEIPENPAGSTVALSVNFAAAADGVDLRAEAKVVRRGGRLSFCEVRLSDPEGAVIAHGIATYRFG
jgi:uncharacterized protein (TIGR00369 family)